MKTRTFILSVIVLLVSLYPVGLLAQPIMQKIDSLQKLLKTAKEDSNKVNTLNALSIQLWYSADYPGQEKYAAGALWLAEKINFKKGMADACTNIGKVRGLQGNYPEALKNFTAALKISEEAGYKNGMVDAYNGIGTNSYRLGNYPEALKNNMAALKISEESGYKEGIADSYRGIGYSYIRQGNYPEGLKNHTASFKICEETGSKYGIAQSYHGIANTYSIQGNYPEAMKNYLAGLKISEEIGGKRLIALLNLDIGSIYNAQGNYPEALKFYSAGAGILEKIGEKRLFALSQNNIGLIYYQQGNYPEALKNYLAGIKINEEIGDKQGTAIGYNIIGVLYYYQGNYPEALKNYLISLKISEAIGYKLGIAASEINLGKLNIKLNKPDEAKKYLDKGLSLAKEIGSKVNIREAYSGLTSLDSLQGNFQSAYENYKMFVLYRDSLTGKETSEKIVRQQMQFDFDKKEATSKQEQEQKLAAEKLRFEQLRADDQIKQARISFETQLQFEKETTAERSRQDQLMAETKLGFEQGKAAQDILQQKAIAAANLQKEKAVADERIKQEKAKAAEEKRNNRIKMIAAFLIVSLLFITVLVRQRNRRIRAIDKAIAAHKVADMEMQSLRAQLNPHFMFNSLNAIQELILMEENEKSHSYLARFSKLMRLMLENTEKPFIPLQREIDFIKLYLSLENLRIPELQTSLTVDLAIDTEQTSIPNMILQPYIENAIWHGLSHKPTDKKLQIRITKTNGAIQYEIEDNGVGRKKSAELKSLFRKEHKSKGMELLSKRFKLLSKELGADIVTSYEDVLNNGEVAGTLVTIKVPNNFSEEIKKPIV